MAPSSDEPSPTPPMLWSEDGTTRNRGKALACEDSVAGRKTCGRVACKTLVPNFLCGWKPPLARPVVVIWCVGHGMAVSRARKHRIHGQVFAERHVPRSPIASGLSPCWALGRISHDIADRQIPTNCSTFCRCTVLVSTPFRSNWSENRSNVRRHDGNHHTALRVVSAAEPGLTLDTVQEG